MCFFVLLGLIVPRLTLALIWLFRPIMVQVLSPWWLGVLGFLFVPFTTLAYVLVHSQSGSVEITHAGHVIILIVALMMDMGTLRGSKRKHSSSSDD